MFASEGVARSDLENRIMAGYLAAVAGFVNSAGFILIGSFTSHVTGNVGRLADDVALGHPDAAALAAVLVVAFFAGAFVASMAMETQLLARRAHVYASLLLVEAGLLFGFMEVSRLIGAANPRASDAAAAILCFAMGMQNSLVTRLSGAVVRTTHLTGVVTDLGIEGARWFRYWRTRIAVERRLRLSISRTPAERPHAPKAALLLTIFASFVAGAALGAVGSSSLGHRAMWLATAALLAAAALSFVTARPIDPASRR